MAKKTQVVEDPLDRLDPPQADEEYAEEVAEMADETEDGPTADDIAAKLEEFGHKLIASARDKKGSRLVLREVEKFLGGLKIEDYPELAESDIVQRFVDMVRPKDLQPGETRNRGTLAEQRRDWTIEDLRSFPKRTIVPTESIKLIWNGIECFVAEGEPVAIPEPFADIWDQHVKAVRQAKINERFLLGLSDTPPDPAWISDNTYLIRGYSKMGKGSIGVGVVAMGPEDEGAGAETAEADVAEG